MTTALLYPAPPLSPTYMPNFLHRSPSLSSLNTRQRCDFEASQSYSSLPPAFNLPEAVLGDDSVEPAEEGVEGETATGYPGEEMPFSREPALEGELETELPPLKKLKPSCGREAEEDDAEVLAAGSQGVVAGKDVAAVPVKVVKGILARKLSGGSAGCEDIEMADSPTCSSTPSTNRSLQNSTAALAPIVPSHLPRSHLAVNGTPPTSRPMSRRSSSGASSCGSSGLKAVRFCSGNGFSSFHSAFASEDLPVLSDAVSSSIDEEEWGEWREREKEVAEGPVAAVVYLTHSREAYDRSPIVVDGAAGALKLPPRDKKVGARGWIKCGKRAAAGAGAKKEPVEGEALKDSTREKLRLEIEALGTPGLGLSRDDETDCTGASPLLKKIGLTEVDEVDLHGGKTEADPDSITGRIEGWRHRSLLAHAHTIRDDLTESPVTCSPSTILPPVASTSSGLNYFHHPSPPSLGSSSLSEEHSETSSNVEADPNFLAPDAPADVDLAEVASDVGDENPGDALSDDGSEGSAGRAGDKEQDVDQEEEEAGVVGAGEKDDDAEEEEEVVEEEEEEEEVDPEEEVDRRRRRQMGMCGLGKWSRGDLFGAGACDALGGF